MRRETKNSILVLSFLAMIIIPIWICNEYDINFDSVVVFYFILIAIFLFIIGFFVVSVTSFELDEYEGNSYTNKYPQKPVVFFNIKNNEKERNGGLTNSEVKERKKLIRTKIDGTNKIKDNKPSKN